MSAACRRFPTPSTTPSRFWAPPTSRCPTTTGAIGGRQRNWEYSRRDNLLPPSTRSCAWRGGVGGGGSIRLLLWQRVCGVPPPPPTSRASFARLGPRRFAGGGGEAATV